MAKLFLFIQIQNFQKNWNGTPALKLQTRFWSQFGTQVMVRKTWIFSREIKRVHLFPHSKSKQDTNIYLWWICGFVKCKVNCLTFQIQKWFRTQNKNVRNFYFVATTHLEEELLLRTHKFNFNIFFEALLTNFCAF